MKKDKSNKKNLIIKTSNPKIEHFKGVDMYVLK